MSGDALELDFRLAFDGFRLDIAQRVELAGVTALFGPSGSGKSSLLRAIAGFETPSDGRVACGEEPWFDRMAGIDVPPHRRAVGFMFQDTRLFGHLDVAGNLAFAQKRARGQGNGIGRREVVAALDLEPLLARRIGSLSGGERQRVALARTLLTTPRLMLLDEPLAALDRRRKAEILPYLEDLPRRFALPTIYVSHDIDEIAQLADRLLVMADGRIRMYGQTASVAAQLDLQALIDPFEAAVLVEGIVSSHDPRLQLTTVDLQGDPLTLPMSGRFEVGRCIRLRIRARDVAIATRRPEGLSIRNVLPGTLSNVQTAGDTAFAEVEVALRGARIRARLTRAAVEELELKPGMPVFALVKSATFEPVD